MKVDVNHHQHLETSLLGGVAFATAAEFILKRLLEKTCLSLVGSKTRSNDLNDVIIII